MSSWGSVAQPFLPQLGRVDGKRLVDNLHGLCTCLSRMKVELWLSVYTSCLWGQEGVDGIWYGGVCKVSKRTGCQPVVKSCMYRGWNNIWSVQCVQICLSILRSAHCNVRTARSTTGAAACRVKVLKFAGMACLSMPLCLSKLWWSVCVPNPGGGHLSETPERHLAVHCCFAASKVSRLSLIHVANLKRFAKRVSESTVAQMQENKEALGNGPENKTSPARYWPKIFLLTDAGRRLQFSWTWTLSRKRNKAGNTWQSQIVYCMNEKNTHDQREIWMDIWYTSRAARGGDRRDWLLWVTDVRAKNTDGSNCPTAWLTNCRTVKLINWLTG